MRLDGVLLLLMTTLLLAGLVHLPVHAGPCRCHKQMKMLRGRVNRLEKRLTAMEKNWKKKWECPSGFVAFQKHCLLFVTEPEGGASWGKSRERCQEMEADLVTINSRRKEKFVAKYLTRNYPYQKVIELYTGLVVTEEDLATRPFLCQHHNTTKTRSIRWVRNNQAVKTHHTPFKYFTRPPFAPWSPKKLLSTPSGTDSLDGSNSSYSCVTISLPYKRSSSNKKLLWSFSHCQGAHMGFVCETNAT